MFTSQRMTSLTRACFAIHNRHIVTRVTRQTNADASGDELVTCNAGGLCLEGF